MPIAEIPDVVHGFSNWVLCGGRSVALWTGQDNRSHGDTDIGVFRSELNQCLESIGREKVFLCRNGSHTARDGDEIPKEVHDIWITDEEKSYWVLQIMVFDDEGSQVIYRRNTNLTWAKERHSIPIGTIRILNPFITFLFKVNQPVWSDKELHDIHVLIEKGGIVPLP